jgi:hypothetical protein
MGFAEMALCSQLPPSRVFAPDEHHSDESTPSGSGHKLKINREVNRIHVQAASSIFPTLITDGNEMNTRSWDFSYL